MQPAFSLDEDDYVLKATERNTAKSPNHIRIALLFLFSI